MHLGNYLCYYSILLVIIVGLSQLMYQATEGPNAVATVCATIEVALASVSRDTVVYIVTPLTGAMITGLDKKKLFVYMYTYCFVKICYYCVVCLFVQPLLYWTSYQLLKLLLSPREHRKVTLSVQRCPSFRTYL